MIKIKGNQNYGFCSILATCLALASTAFDSLQFKTCCICFPATFMYVVGRLATVWVVIHQVLLCC